MTIKQTTRHVILTSKQSQKSSLVLQQLATISGIVLEARKPI